MHGTSPCECRHNPRFTGSGGMMHECGMPIRNLREKEFSLIDGRPLLEPQTKIIEIEGQSKSP